MVEVVAEVRGEEVKKVGERLQGGLNLSARTRRHKTEEVQ